MLLCSSKMVFVTVQQLLVSGVTVASDSSTVLWQDTCVHVVQTALLGLICSAWAHWYIE